MRIHDVSLRNIRSYEALDLTFEDGITLLSGDIGAGKSTILQALEFAFFGIQRGGLEGESLLRHGSDEGSVRITFSVQNKEVTILRNLKRTSQGVRQTEGTLTIDTITESLSAVEMKARILEILGYPEQLLTKSKGLIFRHTVYTPQEEMKHIIFMPAEDRLNTLRILFGIDKYKTIKENTQLYLRELRSQEKFLQQSASQVPELERKHADAAAKAATTQLQVSEAQVVVNQHQAALHQVRLKTDDFRNAWEHNLKLEQERALLANRTKELERTISQADEDINRIDQFLSVALEHVEDRTPAIEETRRLSDQAQYQLLDFTRKAAELKAKYQLLADQTNQITTLDECPVCQQSVTQDHKHRVATESQGKQQLLEHELAALHERITLLTNERTQLDAAMQKLNEHQRHYAGHQKEVLQRKEQEAQKQRLIERKATSHHELQTTISRIATLPLPDQQARPVYDAAQQALRQAETALQGALSVLQAATTEHLTMHSQLQLTSERLTQAKQAQQEAAVIQSFRQWLDEHFITLITVIEQHVLASIHAEFRELFQTWFGKLVEDETIQVSLGEQFEPIVTQNGYDATLEQLSGGEKTAVALSYRLSLYKVVSDFISTVHTKDLLILDEPTDGFSTEQLDKVKEVLRELGCTQILLVSHEAQMEGLCDHVVRVQKTLHRSVVT